MTTFYDIILFLPFLVIDTRRFMLIHIAKSLNDNNKKRKENKQHDVDISGFLWQLHMFGER
jgi:hypothetical protein